MTALPHPVVAIHHSRRRSLPQPVLALAVTLCFGACLPPSPERVAPPPPAALDPIPPPAPTPPSDLAADDLPPPEPGTWLSARHVVLPTLEAARAVRQQALSGVPLDQLARTQSVGPSAGRGGDLGIFLAGTYDPRFEATVVSVPPTKLAPLVQTNQGWHVVQRQPAEVALAVRWPDGATPPDADQAVWVTPGRWPDPLADAALALQPGETSAPVVVSTPGDLTWRVRRLK